MPVNKVVFGAVAIMDISDSTVTPETLAEGETAYDKTGAKITGTMKSSEDLTAPLDAQEAKLNALLSSLDGKAAGGGTGEPDPRDQYQRVEYIESAEEGTYPYIITDFIADNGSGLEVVASFSVLHDRIPMGSRVDSGGNRFYCVYPMSETSFYFGFNTGSSISVKPTTDTVYRLQTNFVNSRMINIYDIDGIRKGGTTISQTLVQQECPVSIFGYNRADTGNVTSKREYKLYSARCSQGHEVVREYIPCYRKSDGIVGVYERFTGTFLTAEEGAFAKGSDIDW